MVDLRRLVEPGRPITYGIVLPGENVSDGVPIIKSGDCTPERLSPATLHRTTHAIASRYERSRLRGGDLVFSIRGTVGLVAVLPSSLDGANLTQDAARIAPTPETHRGWLLHVLRSTPIQIEVAHRTVGATVRGLNLRELRRLSLPRPPFAEQQRIAAFLDERTALIDAAAEKTRRAIELLREYRQSLITAAVTGRVSSEAISQ
jgi:type I restriction enzyme S subunit